MRSSAQDSFAPRDRDPGCQEKLADMQELLTAVWLEAAWQIFRIERGSKLGRKQWFQKAAWAIQEAERSRVYN